MGVLNRLGAKIKTAIRGQPDLVERTMQSQEARKRSKIRNEANHKMFDLMHCMDEESDFEQQARTRAIERRRRYPPKGPWPRGLASVDGELVASDGTCYVRTTGRTLRKIGVRK